MEQLVTESRSRQLFEGTIFSIIERGADHSVREGMNYKYISFDWVGPCGWFFWPRTRRGVYQVKEQSAKQKGDDTTAIFSLYYYPHPDEDVFGDYSFAEQLARVSEVFGSQGVQFFSACSGYGHDDCREEPFQDLRAGKGIPVPAVRERLSASLYWVGALTFRWHREELGELTLEAPFRSRTWAIVDIPAPQDGEPVLRAGDVDRNVPCWHLAWTFATALAKDLGRSVRYIRREGDCGTDAMKRCVVGLAGINRKGG